MDEAPTPPVLTLRMVLLVAVGVVVVFLAFLLAGTGGHFAPPVVDLYLVCQYAKAMAEGHPFQYNVGDAPSTGATSLLHTAILAMAHAAGARGEGLIAFAFAFGAVCHTLTVSLAWRIGLRLAGRHAAALAALLVAFGGPTTWAFLYGSDTALFMLLSTWFLERMLAEWTKGPLRWLPVAGGLLALTRPEGLPLGLLLAGAASVPRLRGRVWAKRERTVVFAPVAVALAMVLVYGTITGSFVGSSMADKSMLANYGWQGTVMLVTEYAIDVLRGLLMGFYPSQVPVGLARGFAPFYFPPLALLLVTAALVNAKSEERLPLGLWLAAVASVWLLGAPNVFLGVHFNRHLMWAFPGLLALSGVGVVQAAVWAAGRDSKLLRRLTFAGAGLALALATLSTLRMAAAFGEMAGTTQRREGTTAAWIVRHLPPGVAIANAATSIEYLTGHRNLNLHGVTSPAFFGSTTAEREAGTFESFGRLPLADRPPFLLTSVETQAASELLRNLADGDPLYRSTSLGDELLIYRLRHDIVGRNGDLVTHAALAATQGLVEVDRLNVCDRRDEASHDYQYDSAIGSIRLFGRFRLDTYASASAAQPLADAGRPILGTEAFTLRTPVRDKDLLLVLRTNQTADAAVMRPTGATTTTLTFPDPDLEVGVDGRVAWHGPLGVDRGWNEIVVRIPKEFVHADRTRLRLRGDYSSFYYWAFQ